MASEVITFGTDALGLSARAARKKPLIVTTTAAQGTAMEVIVPPDTPPAVAMTAGLPASKDIRTLLAETPVGLQPAVALIKLAGDFGDYVLKAAEKAPGNILEMWLLGMAAVTSCYFPQFAPLKASEPTGATFTPALVP
jgi:hypothetical protein